MAEERYAEEYPVCPHCGRVDRDWWDVSPPRRISDGAEWETECGTCEKTYIVRVHEHISFDTRVPVSPSWKCDECGEHVLESDTHKCWRTGLVIKRPGLE